MAATAPGSTAALLELLRKSNILPAARLKAVSDLATLPPEPAKAAAVFVQRGLLTKFQAAQLLAGRHKGFRIGPYVIQEQIGRGGMGAVYQAEHLDLSRKVAIKVLAPGKGEDQNLALERFLREARSAAALDHPNIVRIHDVARHNETPYLVMEFVDGDTLQQCVDLGGPLPFEAAAEYVAQAAAGLQHAHEKGFIHRDIKPANLIRDRLGAVKILDMGLARSGDARDKLTELLDEGAVVGTADYISPEQAMNSPDVDARADIYSLGATLFTLVAGKAPFEGNTTQKLMQHQLRTAPPIRDINPDVPDELAAVIAKMLAKKPDDRYQTAAEVVDALSRWAASSTRVLAGLSQTSLGATGTHAALGQLTEANSRRLLSTVRRDPDSAVDAGERTTGVLSAADTLRDPVGEPVAPGTAPKPKRKPATAPRGRARLVAALGLALAAAVAVFAYLAFGNKPVEKAQTPPAPQPSPAVPAPAANPQPAPKPPKAEPPKAEPPRPAPQEEVVYRFDAASVAPFRVRLKGGAVLEGKRGALPAGVAVYALKDGEAGFAAAPIDGTAALSITRHAAAGDTHVAFELERDAAAQGVGLNLKPGTDYKLRVRYRSEGGAQLSASVHTLGYKGGASKTFPAAPAWTTAELRFTRTDPMRSTLAALGPVGSSLAVATVEVVELRGERVRAQLDLVGQEAFVTRSGMTADPADATKKYYLPISHTGPGALPAGWQARVWNPGSEMAAFAEADAGAPVLGVRNLRGSAAMLFTPRFEAPSGVVRVRFDYRATGRDKTLTVKFKSDDQRPAWEVARPSVGDKWQTSDQLVDLKGASGGYLEFHFTDPAPDAAFRLRALGVTEPNSASPDKQMFVLDAAALPDFQNLKTGRDKTAGDDDPRVPGVQFVGWKAETRGAWTCGPVADARAIGITNLNDVLSAQIGVDLEGNPGANLRFEPGQIVRLRVTYRTTGKGRGETYFQNIDDRKTFGQTALPNSNGEWKTVELVTTRGASPLRFLIDTREKGEGNTLFVRSATVSEVGPPRPVTAAPPAPTTGGAQGASRWPEGATIYSLRASAIPAFRVQKEKGGRLGGDAEKLPAGVACQCWRDGAVGDFRCEPVDGVPALGLTNLNDEKSAQFTFALEGALKLRLEPGKGYRVKVSYLTANDATGQATVQAVPGYKGLTVAPLPGTAGEWKTASVSFVRPPAEDRVELRLAVENTAAGEGNTLWIRSVEVVELVAPEK
jgi:serine/threonine-protein kinase